MHNHVQTDFSKKKKKKRPKRQTLGTRNAIQTSIKPLVQYKYLPFNNTKSVWSYNKNGRALLHFNYNGAERTCKGKIDLSRVDAIS